MSVTHDEHLLKDYRFHGSARPVEQSQKRNLVASVSLGLLATVGALFCVIAVSGLAAPAFSAGTALAACVIVVLFPSAQLFRLLAGSSATGLSRTAWLLIFWSVSAWSVYGVAQNDVYQTVTHFIAIPIVAAVIYQIHKLKPIPLRLVTACASGIAVSVVLAVFLGEYGSAVSTWTVAAIIGFSTVRAANKNRDVSGVSIWALNLSSFGQLLWILHASPEGKWVVVGHALLVIGLNTTTASICWLKTKS